MSEAAETYPEPETFTGADGKTYRVKPLTLNSLMLIERRYDVESIDDLFDTKKLQLNKLTNLRFLLWICLRQAQPNLSEEETGDIIDVGNLPAARDAVVAAFTHGLPQKPAQEAEPSADPQNSPAGEGS